MENGDKISGFEQIGTPLPLYNKSLMLFNWKIAEEPYSYIITTEDDPFPKNIFYADDHDDGSRWFMTSADTMNNIRLHKYVVLTRFTTTTQIPNIRSMIETIKEIQDSKETVG